MKKMDSSCRKRKYIIIKKKQLKEIKVYTSLTKRVKKKKK